MIISTMKTHGTELCKTISRRLQVLRFRYCSVESKKNSKNFKKGFFDIKTKTQTNFKNAFFSLFQTSNVWFLSNKKLPFFKIKNLKFLFKKMVNFLKFFVREKL